MRECRPSGNPDLLARSGQELAVDEELRPFLGVLYLVEVRDENRQVSGPYWLFRVSRRRLVIIRNLFRF